MRAASFEDEMGQGLEVLGSIVRSWMWED
jgi:hypothetical protein